jgi:hypothetical protein
VLAYWKFESISLQQRVRCELDLVAGQNNAMIAAPYFGRYEMRVIDGKRQFERR